MLPLAAASGVRGDLRGHLADLGDLVLRRLDHLDLTRARALLATLVGDGQQGVLARLLERDLRGEHRGERVLLAGRLPRAVAPSVSSTSAGAEVRALGARLRRRRHVQRRRRVEELALAVDHSERHPVAIGRRTPTRRARAGPWAPPSVGDLLQRLPLRRRERRRLRFLRRRARARAGRPWRARAGPRPAEPLPPRRSPRAAPHRARSGQRSGGACAVRVAKAGALSWPGIRTALAESTELRSGAGPRAMTLTGASGSISATTR